MKSQIFLLFTTLVLSIRAQQNDYTVKFDSLEIVSYNKDLVENPQVVLFQYNETSQGVNASGTLKKSLGKDIILNMDASKQQENGEFKPLSNFNNVNMCDLIDKNQFGLKDLLQYTNMTVCPWQAAFYVASNAMVDMTKLPPKAPEGKYTMNVQYFTGSTPLMTVKFVGAVVPK